MTRRRVGSSFSVRAGGLWRSFLSTALLAATFSHCGAKLGGPAHGPAHSVDVVIFANPAYAAGVAAAVNSSRFHSKSRVRVFVGFDGEPEVLLQYLACVGVDSKDVIVRRPVELVDRADIPKAAQRKDSTRPGLDKSRLANAANYARFTITTSFPEVKTAWYIDSDALPIGDLGGAEYANFVRSGRLIQPAIRSGTVERQFDRAVLAIYQTKYGRPFKLGAPSWNAGVWLADFAQWDKLHIAEEAVFWVGQANEFAAKGLGRLWKLNTQPIMYLLFHAAVRKPAQFLAHGWNCESVDYVITDEAPKGCKVIHWNGGDKPWVASANGHGLWRQYLPRFDAPECAALIYVPPPEPPAFVAEEAGGGAGEQQPPEGGDAAGGEDAQADAGGAGAEEGNGDAPEEAAAAEEGGEAEADQGAGGAAEEAQAEEAQGDASAPAAGDGDAPAAAAELAEDPPQSPGEADQSAPAASPPSGGALSWIFGKRN